MEQKYELSVWENEIVTNETNPYEMNDKLAYRTFSYPRTQLSDCTFIGINDNLLPGINQNLENTKHFSRYPLQVSNIEQTQDKMVLNVKGQLESWKPQSSYKYLDYRIHQIAIDGLWNEGDFRGNRYMFYSIKPTIQSLSPEAMGRFKLYLKNGKSNDGSKLILPGDEYPQDTGIYLNLNNGETSSFARSVTESNPFDTYICFILDNETETKIDTNFEVKIEIKFYGYTTDIPTLSISGCINSIISHGERNLPTFDYMDEHKLIVFGGTDLDTRAKAENVVLTENINDMAQLTFDMYTNYYDAAAQSMVKNPYLEFLKNEAKVKLKRGNDWYDFIVKEKIEDREESKCSFVCKDANATLLAKQGFELELADELYNNQGTLKEVVDAVLENCDWEKGTIETVYEKHEETFVEFLLTGNARQGYEFGYLKYDDIPFTNSVSFSPQTVYVPYSVLASAKTDDYVPFYTTLEGLPKDKNGIIDDDCENLKYFKYDENYDNASREAAVPTEYRVRYSPLFEITKYRPGIQEYVTNIYKKESSGGPTEAGYQLRKATTYNIMDLTTELAVNGGSGEEGAIVNTEGWLAQLPDDLDFGNFYANDTPLKVLNNWNINAYANNASYMLSYVAASDGVLFNRILGGGSNLNSLDAGDTLRVEFSGTASMGFININSFDDDLVCVVPYTFDEDGLLQHADNPLTTISSVVRISNTSFSSGGTMATFIIDLKLKENITKKDLEKTQYALLLNVCKNGSDLHIHRLSVYKVVTVIQDDVPYVIAPDGKLRAKTFNQTPLPTLEQYLGVNAVTYPNESITEYRIYAENHFEPSAKDELYNYLYTGIKLSDDYAPILSPEKRRNIQVKDSNYYNALQEIAENFGVWMRLNVEHNEDGSLALDDTTKIPKRTVSFYNQSGRDQQVGIKYGINELNIQRTVNTDQFVTKLIAKDNTNKYGQDGFCTVSRSQFNPTRDNILYNWDYLIENGLTPADTKTRLSQYEENMQQDATKIQTLISESVSLALERTRVEAENQTMSQFRNKGREELGNLMREFYATYEISYNTLKISVKESGWGIYSSDNNLNPINPTTNKHTRPCLVNGEGTVESPYTFIVPNIAAAIAAIEELKFRCDTQYTAAVTSSSMRLTEIDNRLTEINNRLLVLNSRRNQIRAEFLRLFSPYIQEGTWYSDNYIDDNLYYLDAKAAFERYSKPQLSYEISVVDIHALKGYEDYELKVGDRTHIEDEEFLGKGKTEEVLVTERTSNLDDPTQDQLVVQNYRDSFAELFQKLVMDVQSVGN